NIFMYCRLLLIEAGCTQEYTTKTVSVGEDVTLTCSRRHNSSGFLFWMKVVAGNLPEVLGATYTFDSNIANFTPHITTKQEPGTFLLHIKQTELKDTAFYYCEEIIELQKSLWNLPSLPVHQTDAVALQCLVQSESDDHTSSDHHSVHWFKANDDESHSTKLYVHGKSKSKCERIPETPSVRKCVHNFSLSDVGSSDAGTYYCAVVTCGHLLFGKGTKLEIEGIITNVRFKLFLVQKLFSTPDSEIAVAQYSQAVSWVYSELKSRSCEFSPSSCFIFFLQTNEDSLIYSVPNFAKKKAEQKGKRGAKAAEGQIIYAGVRTLGYE
uniref:Ig-like domain-containing protein n=1 Tax=Poecilia reticulata TaxID=8081 RepID=A0A3P9PI92_POERE